MSSTRSAWIVTGLYGPIDYAQAAKWLGLSANQGNPLAQFRLSILYFQGNGVPKDIQKGTELVRQSADSGYYTAMLMYGQMLRIGPYGPKYPEAAFKYLKTAADQGVLEAQSTISSMYFTGEGVARDYEMAYVYGRLAALNNETSVPKLAADQQELRSKGMANANSAYMQLTPAQKARAEQMLKEWKPKERLQGRFLRPS